MPKAQVIQINWQFTDSVGIMQVEHTADCFRGAWFKSALSTEVWHPRHIWRETAFQFAEVAYWPWMARHMSRHISRIQLLYKMWPGFMHANLESSSMFTYFTNISIETLSQHCNVPNWEAVKMQPCHGLLEPLNLTCYMQVTMTYLQNTSLNTLQANSFTRYIIVQTLHWQQTSVSQILVQPI